MMENDDTLIKNFMLANKHEIEDNGFSRGVIRRLPQPAQWLSDILSVTCAIVCCALFYIFNGFEILCQTISDIVTSQTYYLVSDTNFQSLVIATAVLIIIGLQTCMQPEMVKTEIELGSCSEKERFCVLLQSIK